MRLVGHKVSTGRMKHIFKIEVGNPEKNGTVWEAYALMGRKC
jgi:hypothetical protein